jgi:16S rRNA (cytosine967-C5)-methyltransferase
VPIAPARIAAFEILLRVSEQDAFASELLHSRPYQKLTPADHHLATELVMGVLRWCSVLDEEIATRSSLKLLKLDDEVRTALRLGCYQMMYLTRTPAHAVIHDSVELVKRARKRSAAAFVNAVLRKLASANLRRPESSRTPEEQNASNLAGSYAHPEWLVQRWVKAFGISSAREICRYDQQVPESAVVISGNVDESMLASAGVRLSPGRLLRSSRRIESGDAEKLAGKVAIQDEGSRLIAMLVGSGTRILDCCAAPGGKTRTLAERNPNSLVLASDVRPYRARLLRKLVSATNVSVVAADARSLPVATEFDRILADVPCSGTGTLARNPEIKWRLKPEDLADLQLRQVAIVRSALEHLAPAGQLIYSTCSLEREENEDVVNQVLKDDRTFSLVDCHSRLQELRDEHELMWESPDSLTSGQFLRTVPGVHPCDGFFAAIIERSR